MYVWSFSYGLKWFNEYYLNNLLDKLNYQNCFPSSEFKYRHIEVWINIHPQLNSINHFLPICSFFIIVKPTRIIDILKSIFGNIYLNVITPDITMSNLTSTAHNTLLLLTFYQIHHPQNYIYIYMELWRI